MRHHKIDLTAVVSDLKFFYIFFVFGLTSSYPVLMKTEKLEARACGNMRAKLDFFFHSIFPQYFFLDFDF